MADLEILIKTKAELSGAESYLASVERQIGAAKAQGKGFEQLEAQAAKARAAIEQFRQTNQVMAEAVAKQQAQAAQQSAIAGKIIDDAAAKEKAAAEAKQKSIQDSVRAIPPVIAHHNALKDAIARQKKEQDDAARSAATFNDKLREIVPGFAKVQDIAQLLGVGSLGVLAGILGAVAGAAKVAASGVREFAEAQDRVARLDAALAQTGQLTEAYREKLQELADEMQKTTGVADDEWLGVLTRLTQFGADQTNIDKFSEAVKNLAGIMGGDVQGAAVAMSKAMQGSFEMFSRYGIVLDENASKTEKLEQLMGTLAQRGGGQLEASTKTLNGQFKQVKLSTEDALKGFGGMIASTGFLQRGLEMAGNAAEWWSDLLSRTIPKVDGLENASSKTTQSIEGQTDATKKAADETERFKTAMSQAADEATKLDSIEKERMSHEDKMDNLAKRQEMAVVKAKLKSGAIDDLTAVGLEASIEAKYATRKFGRQQAYDETKAKAAKALQDRLIAEGSQESESLSIQESRVGTAKERSLIESEIRGYSAKMAGANASDFNRYSALKIRAQERLAALGVDENLGTPEQEQATLDRMRSQREANQPLRDKAIQGAADEFSARRRSMGYRSQEYGYENAASDWETAGKVDSIAVDRMKGGGGQRLNTRAIQAQQQRYAQEVAAFGGDIAAMFQELDANMRSLRQQLKNVRGVASNQRTQ
jgi:hypothetical protein